MRKKFSMRKRFNIGNKWIEFTHSYLVNKKWYSVKLIDGYLFCYRGYTIVIKLK